MAQPTPYNPTVKFATEEAGGVAGRSTVRTAAVDVELTNIATTLGQVLTNIALIQRDDGRLRDLSVDIFNFTAAALVLLGSSGFTVRGAWITATAYSVKDMVTNGTGTYVCAAAHTSGVFATDKAAGKWVTIFDSVVYQAANVTFTPTGTIAATNVQSAIAEVASESLQISAISAYIQTLIDDPDFATALETLKALERPDALQNISILPSMAANVLTVALKTRAGADPSAADKVWVAQRNATAGAGDFNLRSVSAATSLVVSNGSTLGHVNGVPGFIYFYLIDNAGAQELGISSTYFGNSGIVSTTTEGGGGAADSPAIMYSTTARANVPFRCIGRATSTQAVAGNWATAFSALELFPFPENFYKQAAAVASAATINIGTALGNLIDVTGAVAIAAADEAPAGVTKNLRFTSSPAPQLTHGANFQLPGQLNIQLVQFDEVTAVSYGGGTWEITDVRRYGRSGFRARRSTDYAVVTGTFVKALVDQEDYDLNNEFDSVTNNRFVCKIPGIYSFKFNYAFTTGVDQTQKAGLIYRNGAALANAAEWSSFSGNAPVQGGSICTDVQLSIGDYVEAFVYQASGGNLNLYAAGTSFSGVRVQGSP